MTVVVRRCLPAWLAQRPIGGSLQRRAPLGATVCGLWTAASSKDVPMTSKRTTATGKNLKHPVLTGSLLRIWQAIEFVDHAVD
jgi:hypothetical protein